MDETKGHSVLARVKAFRNYIDGVLSRPRRKSEDSEDEHIPLAYNEDEKILGRFKGICSDLLTLAPDVFSDLMSFGVDYSGGETELLAMKNELTYCVETLEHILEHSVSSSTSTYTGSDNYSRTNTPFSQEEQKLLTERVNEVEAYMVKSVSDDKGETQEAEILKEFIKTEFSEVKERLATVGRRDWKMFFS